MSSRTCCRFLFVCSILLCASAALAQSPTTIFQLDGNSADDFLTCVYSVGTPPNAGTECDYWNLINKTGTSGSGRGHSTLNTYIDGTSNTFNFTGGGSKDPNDLSQWKYTSTNTPNKDTLNAAYAAAYNITDFDVIFGADRLSPNGDANIGIWFFQENVCTSGGAFVQCGTTGAANHVNGDVFIVSAFVTGGGVSQIQAYFWDSSCASGVKNPGPGDCAASNLRIPATVNGFAITNSSSVTATWASYSGFTLASPLFFEGGLDITQAFGAGNVPCFSSFLEETRSSQSPTAVLKDFLLGSFPVCHVSVTKTYTCNSFNADDTFNYTYTGAVTNDGGGALFNVTVKDSPTGGTAVTYTCGGLLKGQSKTFPSGDCTSAGTNMVTTKDHPATNIADASAQTSSSGGTAITASTGSVTSKDATDANGNSLCRPVVGIDVSKSCVTAFQATSTGNIEVRVDYTGSVTNTGTLNLISWNVTDAVMGGGLGGGPFNSTATPSLTVATGVSTTTPTGAASYFPIGADALGLTLGRIQFTDTVSATGKASDGSNVGPVTKSASCVICPFGACAAQ